MKKFIIYRSIIRIILKIISWIFISVLSIFIAVLLALQIPIVQTWLTQKAASKLTEMVNFPTHVESVDIRWLDRVILKDVCIKDNENIKMIDIQFLDADFDLVSLLTNPIPTIEVVEITKASVRVQTIGKSTALNIDEFIRALRKLSTTKKSNSSSGGAQFRIETIRLRDAFFSFDDNTVPRMKDQFDHYHFAFKEIYTDIDELRIASDTLDIDLRNLHCVEKYTKLNVREINTFLRITEKSLQLQDLYAKIGKSYISDSLSFSFNEIYDMPYFVDKVNVFLRMDSSVIHTDDLAFFAPGLKNIHDYWTFKGTCSGKVKKFNSKLSFNFGHNSSIVGSVKMDGLPNFNSSFIDFELDKGTISASDMRKYVDDEVTMKVINKFNNVKITKGRFSGFPNDFVTMGKFESDLGTFESDVNLELDENFRNPTYKGELTTNQFNLGKLIDMPNLFQHIDMKGSIVGKGFKVENMDDSIKATISSIGINNYNYKDLKINAKFTNHSFNGLLNVNDENLKLDLDGLMDFKNHRFEFYSDIRKVDLKNLNYSAKNFILKAKLYSDFTNLQTSDLQGKITVVDLGLKYDTNSLLINKLNAHSYKSNDTTRTFNLTSDLINVQADGNFEFDRLILDAQSIVYEYFLNYKNNKTETDAYYLAKSKKKKEKSYGFEYSIKLLKGNSIFNLFLPSISIPYETDINGYFSNGLYSIFTLNTYFNEFNFQKWGLYSSEFNLYSSKSRDSSNVLATVEIGSEKQKYQGKELFNNWITGIKWNHRTIDFDISAEQPWHKNKAKVKGNLFFKDNFAELSFDSSSLKISSSAWNIFTESKIILSNKSITFNNARLESEKEIISLNGYIGDDKSKGLNIKFKDLNLNNLDPFTNLKWIGNANGSINLFDVFQRPNLDGDLKVSNLNIENIKIGDMIARAVWIPEENQVKINSSFFREWGKVLSIDGKLDFNSKESQYNLNVDVNRFRLSIFDTYLKSILSELQGEVNGKLKLRGMLMSPKITGFLDIENGGFKIDYLNTSYHFNERVFIEQDKINLGNVNLYDQYEHKVVLTGELVHSYFSDFKLNIKGELNSVQLINTTLEQNSTYYGEAIVDGDFLFTGSFDNLYITGNATSLKGTHLSIPLTGGASINHQDFIRFVTTNKKASTTDSLKTSSFSGIKMDFNLDITPDAYCEIIFDIRSGDIIRGHGNGKIRMEIDTKGDFNMYGKYTIDKGKYNFTMMNIVNKEFTIAQNSSISWNGNPYEGLMDIKAVFEKSTSLRPIKPIGVSSNDSNLFSRFYPTQVKLDLKGDLMNPSIQMGLDILKTPPELNAYLLNFKSKLVENEQFLNRQVFSLLILGQLSPNDELGLSAQSAARSVSELITNQLSYWLSQVDDNLEIDINLNGLDNEALNTFRLRLAYTFLDGKLKVIRDGGFTNSNNQATTPMFIGDWTVEYLLSPSGNLRAKIFNKTTQNNLTTALTNATNTQAGISILHTQGFDKLMELIKIKTNKKVN